MVSSKNMDKLEQAGQNLGLVFNFRHGHASGPFTSLISTKLTNLKWKAQPKKLKGSLLLAFVLPSKNKKKTF
jgi:hypothetical protein